MCFRKAIHSSPVLTTIVKSDHRNSASYMDALSSKIEAHLAEQLRAAIHLKKLTDEELTRISHLTPRDAQAERTHALADHHGYITELNQQLRQLSNQSGFLNVAAAQFKKFSKRSEIRKALEALQEAELRFDSPAVSARRSAEILQHNSGVALEKSKIPEKQQRGTELKKKISSLNLLQSHSTEVIAAARSDAWKCTTFPLRLANLEELLRLEQIEQASDCVQTLRFQRKPPEDQYKKWITEVAAILSEAASSNSAFTASAKYAQVAMRSIVLSKRSLIQNAQDYLEDLDLQEPQDQWQIISSLLASPYHFENELLWPIYWAMFQASQEIADSLKDTNPHENVINGKLPEKLHQLLKLWAMPKITAMGYPLGMSYFGALEIASTDEETRLGADFGLLVDIDLGGLKCKKIALFQAKKAQEGKANVGSENEQLRKLLATSGLGYYMFYHQRAYSLRPQGPTICPAKDIASLDVIQAKDLDSRSLHVHVHQLGWDLMSFMSFGLFLPNSDIGVTFVDIDDALNIAGGGDAKNLPRFLNVYALSDKTSVMRLRDRVAENYRERQLEQELDKSKEWGPRLR